MASAPLKVTPTATTPCWVCKGDATPTDLLAPYPFYVCTACGFIFRPDLDEAATKEIYEGGTYQTEDIRTGFTDAATTDERLENAAFRLRWLQRHIQRGRLLDVGAAGGAFVLVADRAGFDAFGVEPSPAFARYARNHFGVDVRDGRIEDLDVPAASVDAITMWHVLEHVPRPIDALGVLYRSLKPGGLIAIEVPNIDAAMFDVMGSDWPHLEPHVHANHFNAMTLAQALTSSGFEQAETVTVPHGVYLNWYQRVFSLRYHAHSLHLSRAGVRGMAHPTRHEFIRAIARRPASVG